LQCLRTWKELHGSFSSSKWLVRILRAIVEATANFVTVGVADLFHRRGIQAKPVGDHAPRLAIFLHDALAARALPSHRRASSVGAKGQARVVGRLA
jgi:hypothetical protein